MHKHKSIVGLSVFSATLITLMKKPTGGFIADYEVKFPFHNLILFNLLPGHFKSPFETEQILANLI